MTATSLALALTLAGCGGGAEQAGNGQTAETGPDQNYQQEILSLDEGQRNATFIRAIRDADTEGTCQGVVMSAYVGQYQGVPMWTARCEDGTDWAILIGDTGTAQVMTCTAAEQAGLPSCATRPTA
jgi:hypothetical protein